MKNHIFCLICLVFLQKTAAQNLTISGHSHNDYAQKYPLKTAFNAKMTSIEADVFLVNNQLFVAHEAKEIKPDRTLENLYLKPIDSLIKSGKAYPFILLIDIKTQADSALDVVIQQLSFYNTFVNRDCPIKFVISGNRPKPEKWTSYPDFILFDGRPSEIYAAETWQKVGIISESFSKYISKKGQKDIDNETFIRMKTAVESVHKENKKIRFWGTVDNKTVWQALAKMGVDFINTDKPKKLRQFLNKY